MKNFILPLIAAGGVLSAAAQTTKTDYLRDSSLSRWVIDVNLLGGMSSQMYTSANSTINYLNAVNANTGELKFKNGWAYGADAQLGFFFGKKRHFGIGAGFMYMGQQGDAVLDKYHVEYQSKDAMGSTFRQVITGNNLKENVKITNLNIPVMLKYKNRFSKRWGFATDLGALVNVQMKNSYTTNANFDYEAIYRLVPGEGGTTVAVYDGAPTPSVNDWLITKAEYLKYNPNGNMNQYFNDKRALGFRVGLNEPVAASKGTVSYKNPSVGVMVKPSFNYFLSDNVALDFGLFYMYQPFKNDAQTNYRLVGGESNYSSSLNNVTDVSNHVYGLNIGARFFLGNVKDRDHDGIPDKKDKCPDVFGLAEFQGCPDTDGDGIPDYADSCVTVKGLAWFHGCPDSDGDSIIDKEDMCPFNAGPRSLHGCPDRDGDGIIDRDDACPDVAGLVQFHGCPDTDGDGLPDNEDKCPTVAGPISNQGCPIDTIKITTEPVETHIDISTPILFETNKAVVHQSSMPVIDEAAKELKEEKSTIVTIDGHADTTGSEAYNRVLSLKRANAVKTQLTKRGINAKRIKTKGHGSRVPAADNTTREGRAENRRAVMELHPKNRS